MSLLHLRSGPRLYVGLVSRSRAQHNVSWSRSFVTTSSRRTIQTRHNNNTIASRYLLVSSNKQSIRFSTTTSKTNVANFFNRDMAKVGDASRHAAQTTGLKSDSAQRWARIAWWIRVVRIPILITSIYSLGYQQGVLDSVRNPNKIQQVGTNKSV